MSDPTFFSAVEMAEQIRREIISPVELAEAHLAAYGMKELDGVDDRLHPAVTAKSCIAVNE